MLKIRTFAIIPLLFASPTLLAEPLSHDIAQYSYRDGNWSVSGERAITEDFYVTGAFHHSDDLSDVSGTAIKSRVYSAGLMTSTQIDLSTQLYGGVNLVRNEIKTKKNGTILSDEAEFYPAATAGIKLASGPDFEFDANVSHYFSDRDHKNDFFDSTEFQIGGRYFLDQSMSLGLTYVWLNGKDDNMSTDNLSFSFSLYFE